MRPGARIRMTMAGMYHSPVPHAASARPDYLTWGRILGWMVLLAMMFWPRLFLLGFWIFSDLIGDALDGWVLPVLGFLVLPTTTVAYVIMWSVSSDVVAGAEWIVVGLAFLVDLLIWRGLRQLLRS
jgi:hypothetical protein